MMWCSWRLWGRKIRSIYVGYLVYWSQCE